MSIYNTIITTLFLTPVDAKISIMLMLDKFLDVLMPYDCLVCGREGSVLCAWCKPDAVPFVPSSCYRCQKHTADFSVCKSCRRQAPLRHVWVCSTYEAVPKALITGLKYQHKRPCASVMAEYMADLLPYFPNQVVIVPIPTASQRVRVRGFDQATLIAKALGDKIDKPVVSALVRQGQTRQVGAKRALRRQQLADAFKTRKLASIAGRSVLLVDDVTTTGATLQAAAKALKQVGAKEVNAYSVCPGLIRFLNKTVPSKT